MAPMLPSTGETIKIMRRRRRGMSTPDFDNLLFLLPVIKEIINDVLIRVYYPVMTLISGEFNKNKLPSS